MKIGLLDIDCHASKKKWGAMVYPNLALCKIAAYHKAAGDIVEWATPFEEYDILYRSKIFNFSDDDYLVYHFKKEIRGGTGYDIRSLLPVEIDNMQPDLSIYPHLPANTSYGFLTRGCPNTCAWCVVPRKEGGITPYWDIDKVANGNTNIVLMDNNILAAGDYAMEQLQKIIDRGYHVDFNQALDARLVNKENAKLLAQIKWLDNKRIRFGCDTMEQIHDVKRAMLLIDANGFNGQYFLYTMLYGDFLDCYSRIMTFWMMERDIREHIRPGNHVYCHAQPYRNPTCKNTVPQWQIDMARWTNKRSTYIATDFDDFSPRKGFVCRKYLDMYNNGQKI